MKAGNTCCPDGNNSCLPGFVCDTANQCVEGGTETGGGPGVGTGGNGGGPGVGTGGGVNVPTDDGMGPCGTCTGNLQCSGWMSGELCNWQSCACYYNTPTGGDHMKEFYHSSDGRCFQCETEGFACNEAAQSLVNHCYGF
jgi:hypothetical protein